MQVRERDLGDVTVIDLAGRLTVNDGGGLLRNAVQSAVQRGRQRVVLNLSGLYYLDSSCLGEIMGAQLTLCRVGGNLKLAEVPARIREMLRLAGLDRVFELFDEETAAVRSFQA